MHRVVTIFDHSTNEHIVRNIPFDEATDALVNEFCDDSTPREIYEACCELGDAIAMGEPTYELEAYLNVSIDYDVEE